ncbi:hypothetical protein ALC152_05090 [Arcobacter sp. 15-2]|uniref:hypothetical protein n=1 Tax=Arcobacter sp. 15-2 TaxID=3374109 RepID=UPI00399D5485
MKYTIKTKLNLKDKLTIEDKVFSQLEKTREELHRAILLMIERYTFDEFTIEFIDIEIDLIETKINYIKDELEILCELKINIDNKLVLAKKINSIDEFKKGCLEEYFLFIEQLAMNINYLHKNILKESQKVAKTNEAIYEDFIEYFLTVIETRDNYKNLNIKIYDNDNLLLETSRKAKEEFIIKFDFDVDSKKLKINKNMFFRKKQILIKKAYDMSQCI